MNYTSCKVKRYFPLVAKRENKIKLRLSRLSTCNSFSINVNTGVCACHKPLQDKCCILLPKRMVFKIVNRQDNNLTDWKTSRPTLLKISRTFLLMFYNSQVCPMCWFFKTITFLQREKKKTLWEDESFGDSLLRLYRHAWPHFVPLKSQSNNEFRTARELPKVNIMYPRHFICLDNGYRPTKRVSVNITVILTAIKFLNRKRCAAVWQYVLGALEWEDKPSVNFCLLPNGTTKEKDHRSPEIYTHTLPAPWDLCGTRGTRTI